MGFNAQRYEKRAACASALHFLRGSGIGSRAGGGVVAAEEGVGACAGFGDGGFGDVGFDGFVYGGEGGKVVGISAEYEVGDQIGGQDEIAQRAGNEHLVFERCRAERVVQCQHHLYHFVPGLAGAVGNLAPHVGLGEVVCVCMDGRGDGCGEVGQLAASGFQAVKHCLNGRFWHGAACRAGWDR